MSKPNTELVDKIRAIVKSSFYIDDGATMYDTLGDEAKRVEAINQLIIDEVSGLPNKLLKTEISGIAMPRSELDKISIQDLRIAIKELRDK
jgi:hypothetical protein